MRLGDEEYKGFIDLLMDIDFYDLDVYMVGGITGDWDTPDIDLILTGTYDAERISEIMLEAEKLGPFDICYTQDERIKTWQYGDPNIRVQFCKTYDRTRAKAHARFGGVWQEGLYWLPFDLPSRKMKQRKTANYGKPIQLIQNGEQIYF